MAFPTTVTTQISAYHGFGGPFVSSTGNVYVVGRYEGNSAQLQVFKATDPSSSWAGVGVNPTVTSGNPIRQIAAYQFGSHLNVVTRDAAAANSNQLNHHSFNMDSDSWETSNNLIKSTYTCAGPVDDSIVTLVVRSLTDIIVSYEGPQALADIQRARTYYARYLGVGWSADFALDGGGNSHWFPQEAILGSGNRVHFFLCNNTAEDLYQRTLDASNNLEALPAAFDTTTTNQSDEMVQRGVAYSASAGGTVVIAAYLDTFTPTINDVRFTSADVPSPLTIRTDITTPVVPTGGLFRRNMSLAVDVNTVYSTFTNNSNNLYVASSQDAGSWATPGLLLGGASATEVYSNIFTRNGSRKLAVIYTRDNTDIKYTEYTLSIAPSVMTDAPDRFSASAQVRVSSSLSATEAADKFSASGYAIPVVKIGRLSATEATDIFAASGYTTASALHFDNAAGTANAADATSRGLLLTATSGAVLLVFTNMSAVAALSAVHIGATQLSVVADLVYRFSAGLMRANLWVLTAPSAGILTISAEVAGAGTNAFAIAAVTYTGHKTNASPFGGIVTRTATLTSTIALTVSSTAGNVVVVGWGQDSNNPGSVGDHTVSRIRTQAFFTSNMWVTEVIGASTAIASVSITPGSMWGGIGVNLIASAGFSTGLMAATDAPDKFSATGNVITVAVSARLSATGASDIFSATGRLIVVGRLSATGASDIFSASANTITPVHGSAAWTMRQDVAVINPRQPVGLTPMGPSNAGGGAGAKSPENTPWPTDLWDVREAYLLSLYPEGPHPAPELEDNTKAWQEYEDRKQQLVNLTAERAHAIVELRESPDVATMKACGAHIKELTAKIATLTGKQDFARFMRH